MLFKVRQLSWSMNVSKTRLTAKGDTLKSSEKNKLLRAMCSSEGDPAFI